MEFRFGRDIVTFKNLIELKVDDEELEVMVQDAKLILEKLRELEAYKEEAEESPTLQFLQALTEFNP